MRLSLLLGGSYTLTANAANATALLDLCLQRDLSFSDFSVDHEGGISFRCSISTAKRILAVYGEEGGVRVLRRHGLPSFLYRHRKRVGILVGALLSLLLLVTSQRFLWDIRIKGNESLTDAQVLAELEACGLRVGSLLSTMDPREMENRVLMQSDRISWISIGFHGTVAEVQIIEYQALPQAESRLPANLIAAFDGQIEVLELYRGNAVVKVGQAVRKGELLVSGLYDSSLQGYRYTRAAGKVLARTEHVFVVEIPLTYEEKRYGEPQKSDVWLNFFGFSTKILKNSGNLPPTCDIIEEEKNLFPFLTAAVPIEVRITTQYPYELVTATRTPEAALELAYAALEQQMAALSGDAVLLQKNITTQLSEENLRLECRLVCVEDIARQVEFEINEEPS
ncbi:MAG: sporulation protein YqfD [Clostridia bacterium]|nr:sporulation protein YqfD [Clostridia bacterium]